MDKEKLFFDNQNLIYDYLKKNKQYPDFPMETKEDIFQDASEYLWRACLDYDPQKGAFSTFAYVVMDNWFKKKKHVRRNAPDTVTIEPFLESEMM